MTNPKKIINDPVHGLIQIPSELIFEIIGTPFFQRLRHIRQLGLSEYIYPGAVHTRFHHALGAMHLMTKALSSLRNKGIEINDTEMEACQIAILLHDIGHSPFSHALEYTFGDIAHEQISAMMMSQLAQTYQTESMQIAYKIFENTYQRSFFHDLVSSQLDMDRLDYLQRDSFFTGVVEGRVASERIIQMLNVHNDKLVVEEKGILSIEQYLTARRIMYWQVYLHKTNISAEKMLILTLKRAKKMFLAPQQIGKEEENTAENSLFLPDALTFFWENEKNILTLAQENPNKFLEQYIQLDDHDIWQCLKKWQFHTDKVLSLLSKNLLNRKLFKIRLSNDKNIHSQQKNLIEKTAQNLQISLQDAKWLTPKGITRNKAYTLNKKEIHILKKNGEIQDLSQASDLPNIKALHKIVKKYYVCWNNGE